MEDSIKALQQTIDDISKSDRTDEQKTAHRKMLLKLQSSCLEGIAKTAIKETVNYSEEDIQHYINIILNNGENMQQTALSDYPQYIEAQHSTKWKHLIKQAVKGSCFSKSKFKNKGLCYQRSTLERSKSLHTLRLNMSLLLAPLQQYQALEAKYKAAIKDSCESLEAYSEACLELEQLESVAAERKRIIDEIMNVYDEPLNNLKDKALLLSNIDAFKLKHNATDEQASKVFGVSRRTITNMRKELASVV